MAPAEQDDMDDDHDSGLDGGPGRSNGAGFGLDGVNAELEEWLEFTRGTRGAEIPENGLSDENLARYTQIMPRPSKLRLRSQINAPMVLRLRGMSSRSSQQQDTPQDDTAQGSQQMVLRLRGTRSQTREQQDTLQDGPAQGSQQMALRLRGVRSLDGLARGSEQMALRRRGVRSQDGLAQSSEQQGVASQDDLSQNNSATDAGSDAGQD